MTLARRRAARATGSSWVLALMLVLAMVIAGQAGAPGQTIGRSTMDLEPTDILPDSWPKPPFVTSARRTFAAPELLDAPDEWLDRSLQWVNFVLDRYRPALVEHPLRRAALTRLDDVLHIASAPRKPLVLAFYRDRMARAIEEMERTRVTTGMRIWKLYNHGFLVRTPTVSFAFDVVPGIDGGTFTLPPEMLDRLVAQADALFISHLHGDHASADVARRFLAAGKPVVAPEPLWPDRPELAGSLTVLERSTTTVHDLAIQAGTRRLQVVAYPGHQETKATLDNVTLVTSPEGLAVVHTGDFWQPDEPGDDFEWISQVGRDHAVDVLLPSCWTYRLDRVARGIDPALILTGHENELGHDVFEREDYTQTYSRLFGVAYPSMVMTWGEGFHYDRRLFPGARFRRERRPGG